MSRLLLFLFVLAERWCQAIDKEKLSECLKLTNKSERAECVVKSLPETFYSKSFEVYKNNFKKVYKKQTENNMRYRLFSDAYKKVLKNNLQNGSYKQTINHFADLTSEEFKNSFLTEFKE